MPVSEEWPFVDSYHTNETTGHVEMKNLAVYWLQQSGFSVSDIEDERPYYTDSRDWPGYTDIYAKSGGIEVFIECKKMSASVNQLGKGATLPARNGKLVYVFDPDGIHELISEYIEVPKKRSDGTFEMHRFRLERKYDLPMLDLRAFTTY